LAKKEKNHLFSKLRGVAVRLDGALLQLRVVLRARRPLRRPEDRAFRREGLRALCPPLEVGDLFRAPLPLLREVVYDTEGVVGFLLGGGGRAGGRRGGCSMAEAGTAADAAGGEERK